MTKPAPCQCLKCLRYLAKSRFEGSFDVCEECAPTYAPDYPGAKVGAHMPGIPLAELRESLSDPLSVELLGLLTEECGEVSQRVGKILRWGWKADFEGTTQQHKLEVELGDVLACMMLMIHNGLVTREGVGRAAQSKIKKFQDDADGPRQRLQVAKVFDNALLTLAVPSPGQTHQDAIRNGLTGAMQMFCWSCGEMWHCCTCPGLGTDE